jgi:hypothetical protein
MEKTHPKKRRTDDSRKYFYRLELRYAAQEDAVIGIVFANS